MSAICFEDHSTGFHLSWDFFHAVNLKNKITWFYKSEGNKRKAMQLVISNFSIILNHFYTSYFSGLPKKVGKISFHN